MTLVLEVAFRLQVHSGESRQLTCFTCLLHDQHSSDSNLFHLPIKDQTTRVGTTLMAMESRGEK